MTFEEYHFYSDVAVKMFNYMNGKINRLNSNCSLYLDMYDLINGTYANIRYPNYIAVHIGTIIDSWQNEWSRILPKETYIASTIAWAISHELHHADQVISMLTYNTRTEYRKSVESDVERASYDWVANNARQLSSLVGIRIDISSITSPDLPDEGNYTKATAEQFYKQTIANIIIRDFQLFHKLQIFSNDRLTDDIILNFNGIDSVVIKSNNRYLDESINRFCELAYNYAGYYDVYHIKADMHIVNKDGRKVGIVDFNVSDNFIRPMIFAN